ncbi:MULTISPECIES: methyltransferase [Streptomyces]|uniref:SAM-dependent methyltransferase n=2 Tax=Streptomyces TaxID=1883 RepID=A0A4Q9HTQ4_STRKA|nr:methyltransferase [Streptomyces kasugaensis]TBO58442.1 SAM-dependent methyltransferase [Streptomyces kasugaensis]WSK17060.1 methyltransferase [Streptomyces celluloflavus]
MNEDLREADTEAAGRRSSARVVEEALGFLYPAALRAAAAVGVADHLADGPRTAAELAQATGTDPRNLHRVLRLLATRGLFEEDDRGRFRLTAAGDALRTDAPVSARSAVLMLTDRALWLPSGEMAHCLEKGTSPFGQIFGMPFFDYFAQNEDTAAVFHDGMAAMSDAENEPLADSYGFPATGTVVDVGGGHGGFLLAALRGGPGLRGVLYDRAHVLAGNRIDTSDVAGRCAVEKGDFFASVPPGDLYLLKRILHDWDDEQCVGILRNCRRAMAPGGRVLVVDAVIPPGNAPHQGKTLDLMMMASLVGRERTEADFAELFGAAGLRVARVIPTPTVLSIVEGVADGDGRP